MSHTPHSLHRTVLQSLLVLVFLAIGTSWCTTLAIAAETPAAKPTAKKLAKPTAKKPAKPSHRVVAIYFHRTERCPTCKKIGTYLEEAIKKGLAVESKKGLVSLHMIDFEDRKNAKYTKYYKIKGPTFVLTDVHDGKVTGWKPLPKVWSLVFKKDLFMKYVEAEVRGYLEKK